MMHQVRSSHRRGLIAVAIILVLTTGAAYGYWTTFSTPGSNGAVAATTVSSGGTPSSSAATGTVTVTWNASTMANGAPVSGYLIKRYDQGSHTSQTVLSACAGTIATTSCIESNVPSGAWTYTVTPLVATNWRGAESADSTVVTVDSTPPINALSVSASSGNAMLTGTTVYYRGVAVGSMRITNALSDAQSGPASSATAALGGTSTGWSHSPSTVSTPAGGPYVSSAFGWTAGTSSPPTEVVAGKDTAGNITTTSVSFVDDSTGPTSGTISYADGYQASQSVTVTFAAGTDSGSGVATRQLQRSSAALTAGTCGTFGAFGSFGATGPTSPYVDSSVAGGACYMYRYIVTDAVGNQAIATSAHIAKVDPATPAAPSLSFSALTSAYWSGGASTDVYYRSATTGSFTATASSTSPSGIASYAFASLGTGWSSAPGAIGVNTYSWTSGPAAPGTKNVTATNNAGTTSTGSPFTMVADDTAPTAGSVAYVSGSTGGVTTSVSFTTGSDGGSGLGTRLLQRSSAPVTGITCGTYGPFTTIVGGANPSSPVIDSVSSGNCYRYQYVVNDHVGNQHVASSSSVAHTPFGAAWSFNAGSGTSAVDSSGNGNTATLQAGASWTAGKIGLGALNLTGATNSFATAATSVDTGQSYSVAAWVRPSAVNGFRTFVSMDGTNLSPFYLQVEEGVLKFTIRTTDSVVTALPISVNGPVATVNTWYHLVGVHDKGSQTIRLYVNGVLQGSAAFTSPWTATGNTTIGRAKWNGLGVDFVAGAVDEVRLYDKVLTQAEITALQ